MHAGDHGTKRRVSDSLRHTQPGIPANLQLHHPGARLHFHHSVSVNASFFPRYLVGLFTGSVHVLFIMYRASTIFDLARFKYG